MRTISILRKQDLIVLATITIGTGLHACATQATRPAVTDPSTVAVSPQADTDSSLHIPFPNVFRPGVLTYDFRISSVIQSITGDSVPRTDTSSATAIVSVAFSTESDTRRVQAFIRVDSSRVFGQSVVEHD